MKDKNIMHSIEKKAVIYTCITGNYDQLNNHSYIHPDWDYVCFTDDPSIKNRNNASWEIKPLVFDEMDNARNNRWHKLHPHILFPEYERSIYADSNINILSNELFDDINIAIKESKNISLGPHYIRNCIYDELDACLKFEKDDPEISFTYVLWKNNFRISPLSNTPYRNSKKISLWHNSKHITKEELIRQKRIFSELFKKIKEKHHG